MTGRDEHKPLRYAYAGILKNCGNMHMSAYLEKIQRIRSALEELSSLEKQGETDVDRVAGCSGRIMEEILAFRKDVWESSLRRLGFYLGNLSTSWMLMTMWKKMQKTEITILSLKNIR